MFIPPSPHTFLSFGKICKKNKSKEISKEISSQRYLTLDFILPLEIVFITQPTHPPPPLRNLSLSRGEGVFKKSSSILARSKDLRLGQAHICFRDILKSQGDHTAVDNTETKNGAT